MTEPPPSPPNRSPRTTSPQLSPLRSPPRITLPRVPRETPSPLESPLSPQQPQPQVRETGLIAWVEGIREEMRRENEAFRERLIQENEVWKAAVQREFREELRRLVVEKYLADHKPSSSSEASSVHLPEDPSPSEPRQSLSPLEELIETGPSLMPPPQILSQRQLGKLPQIGPTARRSEKQGGVPAPFVLPRKPRIGSYYAAIVDTDGDDPDGALLAHMIEIATFRPGFLYSHTGTPEPHRDCCATLYFATLRNVHDWMHDVNYAYRLDSDEIERLQKNSGELKRKRRFDAYVRICKVEAEDPWEIFERRRQ